MSTMRRCRIRRWPSTRGGGGRRSRRSTGRGGQRGGVRAAGQGAGRGGAGRLRRRARELDGELTRCWMFAFRLSFSGKAVHRVYASQAQEAFLEGHVTAFEVMGGVPWRQVRYDNLSPAVAKVLAGRNRAETLTVASFRSWYGFEAFYCEPGLDGAHEKGGVEGEIGRFRRRWMVPVPVGGVAGRAERAAGRGRRGRGRAAYRVPGGDASGRISPPRRRGCCRCRARRSTPPRCCGRGRTGSRGSASASAGTRSRPG